MPAEVSRRHFAKLTGLAALGVAAGARHAENDKAASIDRAELSAAFYPDVVARNAIGG
ncbi:hypothetical protein [Bradyrhizobium sp. 192]|uniref:hypothetical protein n=1 Tax=Bradyrhizobium sp. 192 TaxID=2782660 RepID=UPI001FFF44DB|nr:hypothetical protein [Bradyrhizobium sp. 192]UPJ58155.1 hypothetical protein IVB24_37535 [Bradyrhizobium sp. 192]